MQVILQNITFLCQQASKEFLLIIHSLFER